MQKRGKPRKTERNKAMMLDYLQSRKDGTMTKVKDIGLKYGISESQCYMIIKREIQESLGDKCMVRTPKGYKHNDLTG